MTSVFPCTRKKNHPDDTHDALYVRGWTYVLVWTEALKRADKANALNGPGVKAALEQLKDFDLLLAARSAPEIREGHLGNVAVDLKPALEKASQRWSFRIDERHDLRHRLSSSLEHDPAAAAIKLVEQGWAGALELAHAGYPHPRW